MKFVLSAICSFLGIASASLLPPLPGGSWSNSHRYDAVAGTYEFRYQGDDGSVVYRYQIESMGTLAGLWCEVQGNAAFQPASSGGIRFRSSSAEYAPWDGSVTYALLGVDTTGDSLQVHWRAHFGGDSLEYGWVFRIAGRTLTVHATTQSGAGNVAGLTLDRTEHTPGATAVPIPYLPILQALSVYGGFLTFYTDWENSQASTIRPMAGIFSDSSLYFAQEIGYLRNSAGVRRSLDETLYLTFSPDLMGTLPRLPNPVSPRKSESASRIVLDLWEGGFAQHGHRIQALADAGADSLWAIVHVWQAGGYDAKYPDVMPSNSGLGGDDSMQVLSHAVSASGGLLALHENYVDIYPDAASWDPAWVALDTSGAWKPAWLNTYTGIQSYGIKPSLAIRLAALWSPAIHSAYETSSSFVDVHASVNPSDRLDLDAAEPSGGLFTNTLTAYRALPDSLRNWHQGPASSEGFMHFLYLGWYDDVEAQINTGAELPQVGADQPLLVDFDLRELHDRAAVHGVGYYERFFGTGYSVVLPRDSVLLYMATEIAYGHCGFIATPERLADHAQAAQLEHSFVLPAQRLYAMSSATEILYDDGGEMVDISTYIQRHPKDWNNRKSDAFLSRVKVVYDNGVVVYVNRHPTRNWTVSGAGSGTWASYHAILGGKDSVGAGLVDQGLQAELPPGSGWLVYLPGGQVVHAQKGKTVADHPFGRSGRGGRWLGNGRRAAGDEATAVLRSGIH